MASNDLADKESTISFVRAVSNENTPPISPPQQAIKNNINWHEELTMPKLYPLPENPLLPIPEKPASPIPVDSLTPIPVDSSTPIPVDSSTPIPVDSSTPIPADSSSPQRVDLPSSTASKLGKDGPTESTSKMSYKESKSESSIQFNHPHRMVCCPPKKGIKALGQAFGLTGKVNMMLWRENFYHRVMENEVGFCVRNACICCVPLCQKNVRNTKKNDGSVIESLMEDDNSESENNQEENNHISGEQDDMEYYRHLCKLEMRMPTHPGKLEKSYRPDYVLSEIRSNEKEFQNLPEEERNKAMKNVEHKLEPKHRHHPWFIIIISIIQLIALIVSIVTGGLAITGVEPKIDLVNGVTTFRGQESYDIWNRPNVWIGPPMGTLISYGAIYAPCMRTDEVVTVILLSQPYAAKNEIGCCVVKKHDVAGSTTFKECGILTMGGGTWHKQRCSKVKPQVGTILKPCCFGYLGNCKMATEKGCKAHRGYYFGSKEHCSEIFCFPHFCGNLGLAADKKWPFMPGTINQSWRYIASLVFHAGILHFAIVFIVQWCAGRPIEAAVGHVRIALVYLFGTIGGNLVGSFFDPYLPQVGCSGGVFSLLGISFIECLQAMHFRKRKYFCELFFVILVMLFLVIMGFFPFVNNFAHFGGLLFGIPVAFAIMPHLCFNRWSCLARRMIFVTSVIVLIIFIVLSITLFYFIQDMSFCKYCYYFDCIPFTPNVCNILVELQGTLSHD